MATGTSLTVGFIGAGRMATALARGLISSGFVGQDAVVASDVFEAARTEFAEQTGARVVATNSEVAQACDVLFLAVKPQHMQGVLNALTGDLGDRHLVISIAAGVPLSVIESVLGPDRRIIRVMPNTPCLVGASAAGFSLGNAATSDDAELVESMLSTVGIAVRVDEKLLPAEVLVLLFDGPPGGLNGYLCTCRRVY